MSPRYLVEVSKVAEKQISSLDRPVQKRIIDSLEVLAETPRPIGAKKLKGLVDVWRIRIGDYRALYTIEDQRLMVLVIKVGHRREVYR